MKSGNNKKIQTTLSGSFAQGDYQNHHIDPHCDGSWGVRHTTNSPYPIDGLGSVLIPMLPMVACPKCKAAYLLPGFLEFVEKAIAGQIIVSDRILMPNEIRFLRYTFDLTQQEVVDAIDAESVSFYSKCETGKLGHAFAADKQVRLKLFYATKLGIDRTEDYSKINLTSNRRESQNPTSPIINMKSFLTKEKVTELEKEFKSKYKLKDLA